MKKLHIALKEGAKYVFKCKKIFVNAVIVTLISVVLGLLAPVFEARIIDTVVYNKGSQNLVSNILIFMIIMIIFALASYLAQYFLDILQVKTGFLNRKDKLSRYQNTSIKYLSKQDATAMTNKVAQACNAPPIFFFDIVLLFPQHLIIVVFCFVMIARYNYMIALLILGMVILDSITYKKVRTIKYKLTDEFYELSSKYGSRTRRQISDAKYIRQHGLSQYFTDKFEKTFDDFLKNIASERKVEIVYNMVNKILNLVLKISVYGFIGLSVMRGDLTVGLFTLLIQYSEKLMASFNILFEEAIYIQDRIVAVDKLKEYNDIYSYENTENKVDEINEINIENLHFEFDDKKIFDNYSMKMEKGQIYNLKGNNGSGKTTLINLILGLYMGDYEGKISYNDESLDNLDIRDLDLHKIGLTEQEPNLLDESIRFNVAFTNEDGVDEQIMNLAKTVNLDEFVLSLEDKLSTKIEQESANLSGGQKQKISIMKALYKNPQVLILDEPTSALDVNSKDTLKEYIVNTKKDRITIIITHDKEFENIADKVIAL